MSDKSFQEQNRYNLLNGMPVSDIKFNQKSTPYQKMNLPPLSNGISASSSRDPSPLPNKQYQHNEFSAKTLRSGVGGNPTKNILLSQPQDGTASSQNILLASTFNSNSPSLITSSPNPNVHLVGALPSKTTPEPTTRLYSQSFVSTKSDDYKSQPLSAVSDLLNNEFSGPTLSPIQKVPSTELNTVPSSISNGQSLRNPKKINSTLPSAQTTGQIPISQIQPTTGSLFTMSTTSSGIVSNSSQLPPHISSISNSKMNQIPLTSNITPSGIVSNSNQLPPHISSISNSKMNQQIPLTSNITPSGTVSNSNHLPPPISGVVPKLNQLVPNATTSSSISSNFNQLPPHNQSLDNSSMHNKNLRVQQNNPMPLTPPNTQVISAAPDQNANRFLNQQSDSMQNRNIVQPFLTQTINQPNTMQNQTQPSIPTAVKNSPLNRKYPSPNVYNNQPPQPVYNQPYQQQNYQNIPPTLSNNAPPKYMQQIQPPPGINNQQQQQQKFLQQPTQQYQQNLNQQFGNMNITQTGFNRLWGAENFDLLQVRNILPAYRMEAPAIHLQPETLNAANCHPDIFRCTMTKIPETSSLLNKSRLPLGVLIHPFRDLNHLPVIQCSTIVRCRACRTYINPFVYFVDNKRWKCNLCYRVNELPEEFQYDPVSKSYGDPSRRPEIKSSTIEYIAPSEYMLRPPQPAVYLFLLDISSLAIESGYLKILCDILTEELDNLPGDSRTQIGFLCYNSALHFYSIGDGVSQPHEMTVVDIDDVFLPSPDSLLVNLKERKELVKDLLAQLPTRFMNTHDNNSALGAALQAALKMASPTGGRVSVFQCTLPTIGPGSLTSREVPSNRASADVQHLNPATDFYKRLALDCSAHQVAVDLFILNGHYIDLSTISGISRFSAGCIHHWPLFKASRILQAQQFENCLRRYLTRKIGYEAVMRIRCTRGLSIHTFHGNFFVRSTDLLSLPNCNPDAGFGMQVAIDESLSDLQTVCFQAALLYTSSKGERRIRVHTLCLPVASNLTDVLNSADQQCIVGLVAKMAVDRSFQSSLSDARDAFINVVVDILSAYKLSLNQGSSTNSGLLAPGSLKLLPLYIAALLKYIAFRTGTSTRLDDRVFAMCEMKSLPLSQLIQEIYPDLYPIHCLTDDGGLQTEDGNIIPQPPRLHLSAEKLESRGAFLMDCGSHLMIYVGHAVTNEFLNNVLGFPHYSAIPDDCYEIAKIATPSNDRLHTFINSLNDEKPYAATLQIIRDNSPLKKQFLDKLIEDRVETALSYYEFLQHLATHVK